MGTAQHGSEDHVKGGLFHRLHLSHEPATGNSHQQLIPVKPLEMVLDLTATLLPKAFASGDALNFAEHTRRRMNIKLVWQGEVASPRPVWKTGMLSVEHHCRMETGRSGEGCTRTGWFLRPWPLLLGYGAT